jgi:hypothetical protein
MSTSMKGMIAGLVATIVLSGMLILKSSMGIAMHLNIITLLTQLGSISVIQAWMDHFIVGVVLWGLAFGAYDSLASRPEAHWIKGLIFGAVTWVLMMVLFMPLAKAGFFGSKIGIEAPAVTLLYHLVYGLVLGTTYGLLTTWVPAKTPQGAPQKT